jgi:hypothetical protein
MLLSEKYKRLATYCPEIFNDSYPYMSYMMEKEVPSDRVQPLQLPHYLFKYKAKVLVYQNMEVDGYVGFYTIGGDFSVN